MEGTGTEPQRPTDTSRTHWPLKKKFKIQFSILVAEITARPAWRACEPIRRRHCLLIRFNGRLPSFFYWPWKQFKFNQKAPNSEAREHSQSSNHLVSFCHTFEAEMSQNPVANRARKFLRSNEITALLKRQNMVIVSCRSFIYFYWAIHCSITSTSPFQNTPSY